MRRQAGRVLVIDEADAVLLLRGGDPSAANDETWWFTPGGGVEGTESSIEAARRELREETGMDATDLVGPIYQRETEFTFEHVEYQQSEDYFLARVRRFELSSSGWTAQEHGSLIDWRWWTLADLETTDETIYPEALSVLLRGILSSR